MIFVRLFKWNYATNRISFVRKKKRDVSVFLSAWKQKTLHGSERRDRMLGQNKSQVLRPSSWKNEPIRLSRPECPQT